MNISDCDCLILCGGLGTRLQGVVGDKPKVMAEVDGRPFLDLIIEHLKGQGIKRIILGTGYQAGAVENYYREHTQGITIDFSREDDPLGTGGALKNAREIITSDPFFALNGDSFLPINFSNFLSFHEKKKALASIVVSQVSQASDFGRLHIDDSDQIVGFYEKVEDSTQPLVSAGIYCFDREIFSLMPERKKFSLETDFFPGLAGQRFYGYRSTKEFIDIGTPQRYKAAKENLKKGK